MKGQKNFFTVSLGVLTPKGEKTCQGPISTIMQNFMPIVTVAEISCVRTKKLTGNNLSGKSGLKLFIISCIFASILDFSEFVHFILVSDHALLHSCAHH